MATSASAHHRSIGPGSGGVFSLGLLDDLLARSAIADDNIEFIRDQRILPLSMLQSTQPEVSRSGLVAEMARRRHAIDLRRLLATGISIRVSATQSGTRRSSIGGALSSPRCSGDRCSPTCTSRRRRVRRCGPTETNLMSSSCNLRARSAGPSTNECPRTRTARLGSRASTRPWWKCGPAIELLESSIGARTWQDRWGLQLRGATSV